MSFNGDGIRTCARRGARREQQAPPHGASRPPVRPSPCLPRRTLACCIQCLRFERGLQAHAPSGSRRGAVSPASRCHPSHLSGRVHVATRNATSSLAHCWLPRPLATPSSSRPLTGHPQNHLTRRFSEWIPAAERRTAAAG